MWQLSNGSVSAPTIASTVPPSPIRCPQRMLGSQYWARLIDSAPPATAASASPSLMACAADTIACNPLPHSRLTLNAGVSTGSPPLTAATRARYMSRTSVWMTLPNTACPTSTGSRPDRATTSLTTVAARSHGGTSFSPPPYLPIAVRTPDSTTTSLCSVMTSPSHVQAAVDGPDLASDVGTLVGGEKADSSRDVVRSAESAQWYLRSDAVEHLLRDGGEHLGCDEAGRDRVHREADSVAQQAGPLELERRLLGERLGKPEQPRFRRGVIGLAYVSGLADHR